MSVPIQSVKLPPIQPETNVSSLPSICDILRDPLTSSQNGENRNSSTLTLNGDVHTTNLPLLCYNPTPRAASDLQKYPRTPHNPLEINSGGASECSRRRNDITQTRDRTQRRDVNLYPELPGTVTRLYEYLHPGCESSFSSPYLLK